MEIKNKYSISIIIPVYNAEKTIKHAIESIYKQNFSDVQIVIVNDGSTDDTKNILAGYLHNDNFLVINQRNQGVSVARNIGIQNASGKYIFFLDSDDYIGNNVLDALYSLAEKKQLELVACEYKQITSGIKESKGIPKVEFYTETKEEVEEHFFDILPKYTTAKLFLRELILANNNFFPINMDLGEDLYFVYSLLRYVTRMGKVENVFYYNVNINANSLSKKYISNMEMNIDLQYRLWKSICEEYVGLKRKYNSNRMSYGYYLTSLYIANFFKYDCRISFREKYHSIKTFVKKHQKDYLSEKGNATSIAEKITAIMIGTENTWLMIALFFIKEKIKLVRNRCVNRS